MTDSAVIQATYANWKPVPSRKVLQLVFEVPIEKQGDVLQILGVPGTDTAEWYAIAKLTAPQVGTKTPAPSQPVKSENTSASIPPVSHQELREKVRKGFADMTRAQQAGFLCKQPQFQEWAALHCETSGMDSYDWTIGYVRMQCGVDSRSQLDGPLRIDSHAKWDRLRDTYEVEMKWGRS